MFYFTTIKLLQYPYFDDDISLVISPLSNKVGENPKFNLDLKQKEEQAFLGYRVRVFGHFRFKF
jgi:hypothetical protein